MVVKPVPSSKEFPKPRFRAYERARIGGVVKYSHSAYGATEREAKTLWTARDRELGGWQNALRAGKPATAPGGSLTVGAYFQGWLDRKHPKSDSEDWSAGTRELYTIRARRVTEDAILSSIALANLTSADTIAWLDRMPADVTSNTKLNTLKLLSASIADACDEGIVQTNAAKIGKRKPAKSKSDIEAFNEDEIKALLATSAGEPHAALISFMVSTGVRQSEAFGLRWENVDLERKSVRICMSVATLNGSSIVQTRTKTGASRTIALPQRLVDQLAQLPRSASGFVFTTADGRHLDRSLFRPYWESLTRRAGVDHKGCHAIRHHHASFLLLAGGTPLEVAARLGHSVAQLLTTYAHILGATDEHLAAMIP